MKRALIIAIVPVVVLLAVWTIPGSAQETKGGDAGTPPGGTAAEAEPQMQEITDAIALFRQRDAEAALKLLKKAVKKDPDSSAPRR